MILNNDDKNLDSFIEGYINYINESYGDETLSESCDMSEMLNEQYFGRNQYTAKLEKECEKLLNVTNLKIKKTKLYNFNSILSDLKQEPEFIKYMNNISEIIKEMFNFKEVYISSTPTGYLSINTVTNFDNSVFINDLDNRIYSKKGIRFKEATNICYINLAIEILALKDLTAPQLVAGLLHEIGHNFYKSYSCWKIGAVQKKFCKILCGYFKLTNEIKNILSSKDFLKYIKSNGDKLEKTIAFSSVPENIQNALMNLKVIAIAFSGKNTLDKILGKIKNSKLISKIHLFDGLFSNIMQLSNVVSNSVGLYNRTKLTYDNIKAIGGITKYVKFNINNIKSIFKTPLMVKFTPATIMESLIKIYKNIYTYPDEQFADNFATMYGYGKELMQFLSIISNTNDDLYSAIMNSNKVTAAIKEITNFKEITIGDISHPKYISRLLDQINFLKENIKYEKDEKYKKIMLQELEELEAYYKEIGEKLKNHDFAKEGKIITDFISNIDYNINGDLIYKVHEVINNKSKHRFEGNWTSNEYKSSYTLKHTTQSIV